MIFYTDDASSEVLLAPGPSVLLYGGFEGFDNYGDVLQLKGAIKFHRENSTMPVIMIVALAAWTTPGLLERLHRNYDVDGFIFEDDAYLDASAEGLKPITDLDAGNLLHVYGGGYFNSYWGERRAYVVEQILYTLQIREWVISGIQVDVEGAAYLQRVFALKMPILVGARDLASVDLLSATVPGDILHYSFDDAVEPIAEIGLALARLGSVESGDRHSIGVHLNITSEYMAPTQLAAGRALIVRASEKYPHHEATILHAYNDSREIIRDALESVTHLSDLAIFTQFDVINFATVASLRELDPPLLRRIMRALAPIDFVITASYHIALTLNLLGKPTFLLATSAYYDDKREALGLANDFEAFLAQPKSFLRDFAAEKLVREEWRATLAAATAKFADEGWTQRFTIESPSTLAEQTVAQRYGRA